MTHYIENAHVPEKDSTDNQRMRDVVGTKTDRSSSNSLYGQNYSQERHVHAEQEVYPTLAAGTTATDNAAGWTLGAFVELIPANTITSPFDLHHVFLTDISAQKDYELVFYQGGSDVEVARIKFQGIAGGKIDHMPIQTPLIAANARIRMKVASEDGGGETVKVAVAYHEYAT